MAGSEVVGRVLQDDETSTEGRCLLTKGLDKLYGIVFGQIQHQAIPRYWVVST